MKKASSRTRVVTGGALVAALALGGFGAYSASATGQDTAAAPAAAAKAEVRNKNTTTSTHLTIEAATKAAQATLDAAEKENQRVSVAVVDRNGNTIVTLRGDGAGPQSYESAERKAFTAVSWNAPTSV
ncbi:heme-binding protein, partial [Streptomyces sp. SP18ES09]|uniref:GlcG/HbpS family heme-binding protein n=1 Tax=Streptomyces sp. SP18ES09 TaxID=3002532 RepID=UPI002E789637